jgi:predicted GIY-YIG superfamily endonuclease
MAYYVYWIQSGARAYIGATVDPKKRLRQHNGEIVGGAARTRNRGPWHFHCVISGFRTWKETLQYEWAAKFYSRRARGIKARQEALEALNMKERWTSKSPMASEVPLTVEYTPTQYGHPPDRYEHEVTSATTKIKRVGRERRKGFKKSMHHVHY